MAIDLTKMTFGLELEIGDVRRDLELPPELGAWEYSETDVVNLRPPYVNVCCDPLGQEPPVGGEINIFPDHTPAGLARKVVSLLRLFEDSGCPGTSNCISHTHVHVRVPGLRDDPALLIRLAEYVFRHQDWVIETIHAFRDFPGMEQVPKARTYLKLDGARRLPEYMLINIRNHTTDLDSFIRMHCAGKDPASRGRPFRYAINMYCLKHTDTVEFRFFRHTLDPREIEDCVTFAARFMMQALKGDLNTRPPIADLKFPPMTFDLAQCKGWEATKYDSSRGKKVRTLHDI